MVSRWLLLTLFVACPNDVHVAFAQDDDKKDPPDFSGIPGMNEKVCPPFRCSKGYVPVPQRRMKLTSSGCSSMGGMAMMMPGSSQDENDPTRPCCDQKNACYQICGTVRSICDDKYKSCLETTCAKIEDEEEKKSCDQKANISTMMLGFADCRQYDEDQRNACECVEKEKAPAKRKAAIENFYKKYAPDGLDKVGGLAAKASDTRKLAGLFLKLVSKYPESIKKVKDPQQEYMDKLNKLAKETDAAKKEGDTDAVFEGEVNLDEL